MIINEVKIRKENNNPPSPPKHPKVKSASFSVLNLRESSKDFPVINDMGINSGSLFSWAYDSCFSRENPEQQQAMDGSNACRSNVRDI